MVLKCTNKTTGKEILIEVINGLVNGVAMNAFIENMSVSSKVEICNDLEVVIEDPVYICGEPVEFDAAYNRMLNEFDESKCAGCPSYYNRPQTWLDPAESGCSNEKEFECHCERMGWERD